MRGKYPFLAYLGQVRTWTRFLTVGVVAFFALVGLKEVEGWSNPASPPATWQGALAFAGALGLVDLLDRYATGQKGERGRYPRWVWGPSFAAALVSFLATGEGLLLAGMSAWVVLRGTAGGKKE